MQSAMARVRTHRESYSALTKQNAAALLMHGVAPPTGDTNTNITELQTALATFNGVKGLDRKNEAIPTADRVVQARGFRRRTTMEDLPSQP